MRLFERDTQKPGKPILHVGLIAFALMFVIGLALLFAKPTVASNMIGLLVLAPIFISLFGLIMVPGLFIQGLLAGTPSVSLVYAFSAAKRNWRGVAGCILLAAASVAAVFAVANIR